MPSAPDTLAGAVSRELGGERVLWAASPDRWAYARRYWSTALFGVPFAASGLFLAWQATSIHAGISRVSDDFLDLVFVIVGLSMLLSPLWAAWTARNTWYVVTERRAVVFEKKFRLDIRSYPRSAVSGYERVSHGARAGDIIFQRVLMRGGKRSTVHEYGFIGLADFAVAERALDKLIAEAVA